MLSKRTVFPVSLLQIKYVQERLDMKVNNKRKNILMAKIGICFIILLLIVLPQVIGTTRVAEERGDPADIRDTF